MFSLSQMSLYERNTRVFVSEYLFFVMGFFMHHTLNVDRKLNSDFLHDSLVCSQYSHQISIFVQVLTGEVKRNSVC